VFCQLESLRHCFPPSVRHTLDELPESLDETYERVLKDIKKQNQGHARRLLQCLVVAIRPLRIEELAEVLAVDFDDAEGIPKLKPDWRWEDHEQALLISCSSLIAIVKTGDTRVVQFSHFSVKEFLTSPRLATSSGDVTRYHIDLEPSHTILSQACLSILLQSVDRVEENDVEKISPLAEYAAQYWVIHAQFKGVSSCLRKAMGYLFDPDRPYFAAWLQLHNIDSGPEPGTSLYLFAYGSKSGTSPLYYAALCGFQDVVEDLVIKCPQHVNARSGRYVTPLVAALAGGHSQTAKYLYDNGAHPNVRGHRRRTPLHSAAWFGDFEMVQLLLDYEVDVNAQDEYNWTALHEVSEGSTFSSQNIPRLPDVARLLLERGTDVNVLGGNNKTPLHMAARNGRVGVLRVLLEHGANVGVEDKEGGTPLHAAVGSGKVEVVSMLLEHGASVGAEDKEGRTPLHAAVENERVGVVRVLLEHGANVGAGDKEGITPFQIASATGFNEMMELLSEYGGK
jgi:ankyrin repeat protein